MKKIIRVILASCLSFVVQLNSYSENYSINGNLGSFFNNQNNFKLNTVVFSDNDKFIENNSFIDFFIEFKTIKENNFNNKFRSLAENTNYETEDVRWMWSFLLPGLGHAVMGEYLKGSSLLISSLILGFFSGFVVAFLGTKINEIMTNEEMKKQLKDASPENVLEKLFLISNKVERINRILMSILNTISIAIYFYSAYDAYQLSLTLKEEKKLKINSLNFSYPIFRF